MNADAHKACAGTALCSQPCDGVHISLMYHANARNAKAKVLRGPSLTFRCLETRDCPLRVPLRGEACARCEVAALGGVSRRLEAVWRSLVSLFHCVFNGILPLASDVYLFNDVQVVFGVVVAVPSRDWPRYEAVAP